MSSNRSLKNKFGSGGPAGVSLGGNRRLWRHSPPGLWTQAASYKLQACDNLAIGFNNNLIIIK
jgi:hypothetical protein